AEQAAQAKLFREYRSQAFQGFPQRLLPGKRADAATIMKGGGEEPRFPHELLGNAEELAAVRRGKIEHATGVALDEFLVIKRSPGATGGGAGRGEGAPRPAATAAGLRRPRFARRCVFRWQTELRMGTAGAITGSGQKARVADPAQHLRRVTPQRPQAHETI